LQKTHFSLNYKKYDVDIYSHLNEGDMIDLTGKISIITGGSRGIGAATAVMFARAGSDVAINYNKRRDAALEVQKKVEKLGKTCVVVQADLSRSQDVNRFIDKVMEKLNRIDILVNNHGIWNDGPIAEMTEETWDEMMNVNPKSIYLLCCKAVPIMRRQGGGKIINLSSTAGQRGEAFHSHYAATKGAIIAFTKSLSTELAPDNILVNCVAPGWVDTDMNTEVFADPKIKQWVIDGIPLKRIPSAEDIAGPILFLASDLARHITGEILNVNGGAILCG
jgi:3-oxoacyl-[acyl-carrier protein] reductase